ncbi:MAG: hypothetical protein ABJF11_08380 [Reichenbachiella sp.]|uniref:hypothetical protein n=1 Tax=Reichenbachiella sp. TaxID=2184521 RepID=UPI003266892A
MKNIFLLFLVLSACQSKNNLEIESTSQVPEYSIFSIDVNDQLAGSAYRKRATGYQLITLLDSSLFIPSFSESNEGAVSIRLSLHPQLTYEKQLDQMRLILPVAAKAYNLDSLRGIYLGRLVQSGDLAIEVTIEYLQIFGGYASTATTEYEKIGVFLSKSKLGQDWNEILQPYGLQVTGASVEKVFYTRPYGPIKIDSSRYSNIEIPDQLLDCMTWLEIRKLQ